MNKTHAAMSRLLKTRTTSVGRYGAVCGLLYSVVASLSLLVLPVFAEHPPAIKGVTVDPPILEMGTGPQSVIVSAAVTDADKNLRRDKVKVVVRPEFSAKVRVKLRDDGIFPDIQADDGRFAARVTIDTNRERWVPIMFKAKDDLGNKTKRGAIVSVVPAGTVPAFEFHLNQVDFEEGRVRFSVRNRETPGKLIGRVGIDQLKKPGRIDLAVVQDFGQLVPSENENGLFTKELQFPIGTPGLVPVRLTIDDGVFPPNSVMQEIDLLVGIGVEIPLEFISVTVVFTSAGVQTTDGGSIRNGLESLHVDSGRLRDARLVSSSDTDRQRTIRVSIGELAQGQVVDGNGDPRTEFELEEGQSLLTFYVRNVKPADEDRVTVPVLVEADGFIPNAENVLLSQLKSTEAALITLSRETDKMGVLPEGSRSTHGDIGIAGGDGVVQNPLVIETPFDNAVCGSAQIEIPSGTRLRQANGQPLSGPLTVTAIFHSVEQVSSLSVVEHNPVRIRHTVAGPVREAYMVDAGIAFFKVVDSAGNAAATYEGEAVTVTLQVPGTVTNPKGGNLSVASGDRVPIWVYNSDDGVWTKIANGTLAESGLLCAGEPVFDMQFTVTQGQKFRVAWEFPNDLDDIAAIEATGESTSCSFSRPIRVFGNDGGGPLTLQVRRDGGGYLDRKVLGTGSVRDPVAKQIDTVVFRRAPRGMPVLFDALLNGNQSVLNAPEEIDDLCDPPSEAIPIVIDLGEVADLGVQVNERCTLSSDVDVTVAVPSASVVFAAEDSEGLSPFTPAGVTDATGGLTISGLEVNRTYQVRVLNRDTGKFAAERRLIVFENAPLEVNFLSSFCDDMDEDGLTDEVEAQFSTNPNKPDSDEDGLLDGEEVKVHRTDPTDIDTDDDGFTDGEEIQAGTDPLDPSSPLSPTASLQVKKSGDGTVTSSSPGISCGSDCTEEYTMGTLVTLTAMPDTGSEFTGWSGIDCPGTDQCSFLIEFSGMVTAMFVRLPTLSWTSAVQTVEENVGTVTVTAFLDSVSSQVVTASVGVTGTATVGIDHDLLDGTTLTIPAGQLSANISLNVFDDPIIEDNEFIVLTMESPLNAAFGTNTVHTVKITSDDDGTGPVFTLGNNGITVSGESFNVNTISSGTAVMNQSATTFDKNSVFIDIPYSRFSGAGTITVNESLTWCISNLSGPGGCDTKDQRALSISLKNLVMNNVGFGTIAFVDLGNAVIEFSGTEANGTTYSLATPFPAISVFSNLGSVAPTGPIRFDLNSLIAAVATNGLPQVDDFLNFVGSRDFKVAMTLSMNTTLAPNTLVACSVANATNNGCVTVTQFESIISLQ